MGWHRALRRYVIVSALANLVWEVLHFPLYTFWKTSTWGQIAVDIAHCTAGDVMLASLTLLSALMVLGRPEWPSLSFARVGALTLALGVAYTIYSEWINVVVRKSWAYAPSRPVLPPFGTGLSPLLQWLIVPSLALCCASRLRSTKVVA
jgi:hypothetical protein